MKPDRNKHKPERGATPEPAAALDTDREAIEVMGESLDGATACQIDDAFEDGARAFATTLLPVLDNLERAVNAADGTAEASLKEGVDMVLRQLSEAFAKRGVTAIDRKGEPFDPNLENAVMQGTPEDGPPGTVCEVFQKGYQMGGCVLRHAMVKVVPE